MYFHPFDVTSPHIIYASLGGFVVLFGMFSLFLREKLYIGEACWAFLFGVIIGPYGGDIFNPRSWGGGNVETTNEITLEITRVVLAIGVFAIGVELPKAYMLRHWKSIFFLIVPVMTYGWFVSAGLIYALIPGLNFLSSLAVAACLTPTDPILAAAVVGGKYADKHVPAHLRHLLAAESGCNDGAAFPFLFISLYLTLEDSTGHALRDWFLELWLYQIILAVVFGSLIGFGFRHLMKFCERKELIDRQSYVAQYVALALLTIGTGTMLGTDDLLAAFCCGTAFAWDGFFNKQTEESVFSSVIDLLFNVACFVYIGAWMPFADFQQTDLTISVWRLIVIAILVLLLRRLPIMMALYKWIPDVKTFREAIFSGHFGPMGVGAVFISTLASKFLPQAEHPPADQRQLLAATIQPIVAFMVLCSILIHGLSIPFFSLGRRVHTVSRTWSMHGAPDWIAHTRRVSRGDDIVINRDSEMERGEFSIEKSGHDTPGGTLTDAPQQMEESSTLETEEAMKKENLPDGDEVVAEWKEGPHRVIERRAGPGEEVEVEVQRNAFGPSESEKTTSSIIVAERTAHRVAAEYLHRLRDTQHNVEHTASQIGDHVHDDLKEIESKIQKVVGSGEGDLEDGWASEGSVGSAHGSISDPRTRSRSPKQKVLGKSHSSTSTSRERNSSRNKRSNSGPIPSHHGQEDRRMSGNASPLRRGLSEPDSRAGSIRNLRLENIKQMGTRSPREQSPARSVRFVDNDRINPPRLYTSPLDSPSPSSPHSQAPSDDEDDSPQSRVTFELPTKHDS